MSSNPSVVAMQLSGEVSPELQKDAQDNEDQVLAGISNPIFRFGAKKAYPYFIDQIPTSVTASYDRLLTHLETRTVDELVELVVAHANQKGETVSDSLKNYKPSS